MKRVALLCLALFAAVAAAAEPSLMILPKTGLGPGDIAVTADIPLAARCLAKGAQVIGHTGQPFTESGIGNALAMRELMSHLRDAGEVRGGGPPFSKRDRSHFLQALENAVQALRKRSKRN